MKRFNPALLAVALAALLPLSAQAHRPWMMPEVAEVEGKDPWVTIRAAISEDLFVVDHNPLALDSLLVTGPDGKPVQAVNAATGKYRSTFDVQLSQPGTYKIAVVNHGVFASYKLDGQQKRWRGSAEALAKAMLAEAEQTAVQSH